MRSYIRGKAKEAPGLEPGYIGGQILTCQPSLLDSYFTLSRARSKDSLYGREGAALVKGLYRRQGKESALVKTKISWQNHPNLPSLLDLFTLPVKFKVFGGLLSLLLTG